MFGFCLLQQLSLPLINALHSTHDIANFCDSFLLQDYRHFLTLTYFIWTECDPHEYGPRIPNLRVSPGVYQTFLGHHSLPTVTTESEAFLIPTLPPAFHPSRHQNYATFLMRQLKSCFLSSFLMELKMVFVLRSIKHLHKYRSFCLKHNSHQW